ncbi:MAG: PAS domain-containing protein [Acidobacteriota bacterium]|nr:PAS domain-containing protein [Acidobacteriota bacterium]
MKEQAPDFAGRAVFDALPIPAFLVNRDVQILELNRAAEQLCGQTRDMVYHRRGGEVLGCLHSADSAAGCGASEACKGCVIRNSVRQSVEGKSVAHRQVTLQLSHGLSIQEVEVLVTASMLSAGDGEPRALLLLEQIPGLDEMSEVVPICMHCKKIWDEEHYWSDVEDFLRRRSKVCFAHGLCPHCAAEFTQEPCADGG